MQQITIKRIDVFTTSPFGGNPAGVVLDADGLSTEAMQEIASEMKMNLIEMAFVFTPISPDADFRVRFFTPDSELDISGHVALAACYALVEDGRIELSDGHTRVFFETRLGNIPLDIYFEADPGAPETGPDNDGIIIRSGRNSGGRLERIMMEQPLYLFRESTIPVGEIAEILGIDPSEITSTGLPVVVASLEFDWLIIPVNSKETILGMSPDLIRLEMMNRKQGLFSNHVFSIDTFNESSVTYSRNFSPVMGVWEDPASASASSGLGTYLRHFDIAPAGSMIMEQGNEAENLATILVEVRALNGDITAVRVGGLAVHSIERSFEYTGAGSS